MSTVSRVCAAFITAAAAASANAAPYVASFDPVFGAPFSSPTLGWRGQTFFDIADACFTGAGAITVGGSCTATITQTTIEFYDVNDPNNTSKRAQLSFAADYSISKFVYDVVGGLNVVQGIAASITSYLSPTGNASYFFGSTIPTFALEFNLGSLVSPTDQPYNGPLLYWQTVSECGCYYLANGKGDDCTQGGTNQTTGAGVPKYSITQIPEPATPALLLASLAGLALVRRRCRA